MVTKIVITRLKIDGYEVPVPTGLSELLENCWVPGPKEAKQLHKYDREVIRKDDRFVTILTRKKKS